MILAAIVFFVIAVLAMAYAMIIIFDKSGVSTYELGLLRAATVVVTAAFLVSALLWTYSYSQAKNKPAVVVQPSKPDTLWLHDTTVKWVKARVDGATKEIKTAAAQAEARTPIFLEKFDAR